MKAVLVIDIDDSLIEGEDRFAIDGYLMQESDCVGCYETVGLIRNAVLKPMPKRKNIYTDIETIGWNHCLEEIENGTD